MFIYFLPKSHTTETECFISQVWRYCTYSNYF